MLHLLCALRGPRRRFILRYFNHPVGLNLAGMLGCSLTDFAMLAVSGCTRRVLSDLTLFDIGSVLYAALVVSAGIHSVLNWCTGRVGEETGGDMV